MSLRQRFGLGPGRVGGSDELLVERRVEIRGERDNSGTVRVDAWRQFWDWVVLVFCCPGAILMIASWIVTGVSRGFHLSDKCLPTSARIGVVVLLVSTVLHPYFRKKAQHMPEMQLEGALVWVLNFFNVLSLVLAGVTWKYTCITKGISGSCVCNEPRLPGETADETNWGNVTSFALALASALYPWAVYLSLKLKRD